MRRGNTLTEKGAAHVADKYIGRDGGAPATKAAHAIKAVQTPVGIHAELLAAVLSKEAGIGIAPTLSVINALMKLQLLSPEELKQKFGVRA